jgi:hypothetical protein
MEKDRASIRDAETLLFGTLAAQKLGEPTLEAWKQQIKAELIETQCKDGCQSGSWTTPSIWSELGGRLASTPLMTWTLEVYYRYPKALWIE